MATEAAAGARAELAHWRTLEVIEEHASPEATERARFFLSASGAPPGAQEPWLLMAFQAELMDGLAEIVKAQGKRIAELEQGKAAPAKKAQRGATTKKGA